MSLREKFSKRNVRSSIEGNVCSCDEPDHIIEDIARMETLFLADVVSQRPDPASTDGNPMITTVAVTEGLIGYFSSGDEVEIHHLTDSSACGIDFNIGSNELISAYMGVDEICQFTIGTDGCSMPYFTTEEYREALRGDGCRSPQQTQTVDFDPVGLKLVVLDEDGQITADEDRERLVMRIDSKTTRVTDYWRG